MEPDGTVVLCVLSSLDDGADTAYRTREREAWEEREVEGIQGKSKGDMLLFSQSSDGPTFVL